MRFTVLCFIFCVYLVYTLTSAGVLVSKEPSGLSRSDGKCPDRLTLIPWCATSYMGCDVALHDGRLLPGSFFSRGRRCSRVVLIQQGGQVCWTFITGRVYPDCGGVPRPNQKGRCSVLERVGKAIGGGDRGCSSIFVFVPTDLHCGAAT